MDMMQSQEKRNGFVPGNAERMAALRAMAKSSKRVPKDKAITLESDAGGEVRLAEIGTFERPNGIVDAFLYSTEKNKHGFFVKLREIRYQNGNTSQTDYQARRKRSDAKALAEASLAKAMAA